MKLSVVIPCFNEVGNIIKLGKEFLPVIEELIDNRLPDGAKIDSAEVVFVDDGSNDGTYDVLIGSFNALINPAIPLPALWFRALPEQWIQMMNLLDEKRPPYIFVAGNAFDVVRYEDTPKMVPYLEQTILHIKENYRLLRSSDVGVWYVLRNR